MQWRNYGGVGARAPPPPNRLAIFIYFLLIIEVCDVRLAKCPILAIFLAKM